VPKITKSAGVLQFDGAPLREFGVNAYYLFYRSVSSGDFTTTTQHLAALRGYGVRIVRTLLCPFWPVQMDVYRNTPTTYFARMQTFLDLCESYGISIVANIGWRYATWTDTGNVNDLATPGSTSRLLAISLTDGTVSRFYTHNAIAAWEIGNEYDLKKDVTTSLPSVSLVDGTKASYSSPNDVLSTAAISGIYSDFVTAVRVYDSDRVVMAGAACAYGTATVANWNSSMAADCSGMGAYSRHIYPGVSGVSQTANTGPNGDNCATAFYGLRQLAKKAEADGNPLIIGEWGCSKTYAYANRADIINRMVDAIIGSNIPLALLWNYPDGPTTDYDITDLMPYMAGWNARMSAGSNLSPQGRIYSSDAGYFAIEKRVT
jgi:hypothetical protein